MDWTTVKKAIVTYLATWSTSAIMYPGQSVRPTSTDWVEIHWLDHQEDFVPGNDSPRGYLLLHVGLFSKSENIYATDILQKELSAFLHQKDLKITGYMLRFGELSGTQIPWRGTENIEKEIQYRACSIRVAIFGE